MSSSVGGAVLQGSRLTSGRCLSKCEEIDALAPRCSNRLHDSVNVGGEIARRDQLGGTQHQRWTLVAAPLPPQVMAAAIVAASWSECRQLAALVAPRSPQVRRTQGCPTFVPDGAAACRMRVRTCICRPFPAHARLWYIHSINSDSRLLTEIITEN